MMTPGSRHTAAKSTQRLLLARRVNFLVNVNNSSAIIEGTGRQTKFASKYNLFAIDLSLSLHLYLYLSPSLSLSCAERERKREEEKWKRTNGEKSVIGVVVSSLQSPGSAYRQFGCMPKMVVHTCYNSQKVTAASV